MQALGAYGKLWLTDGLDWYRQFILPALGLLEEAADAAEAPEVGTMARKAKELAGTVDESVHQNPWAYIGGAAAVGVLIGYILGRNK